VACEMDGIVAGCGVSLSLSRWSSGTVRTGSGAIEADAFGVLWVSSSDSIGVEALEPCFSSGSFGGVAASGASDLGAGGPGGAKERGSAQLLGGYR
jgi:hypothetical protein